MFGISKVFINLLTAFTMLLNPHAALQHNVPTIQDFPTPTAIPTPTISQIMLKATGNINQFGKNATITALFPQNGGKVTGNISGDCTGDIKGTYSGEKNGKQLQGIAYATCPVLLFKLSGTATFSGTLNENDTAAAVNYAAKISNNTQNGTFTFTISPQ